MKRIPLSLQIALRFSRGRQSNMISLISTVSTVGVVFGVAALIIGLSAMNGFERELNNRVLAVVPHGEIEPVDPSFFDWQGMLKRIEQVPGIVAAAPYINFTGLVEHDNRLQLIQLKGVDPVLEVQLSMLPHYVQDNAWAHFQADQQQIILGKGIADTLKVNPGDWLTLMISNNDPKMKLIQPKYIRLQVSGIFMLSGQLDHSLAMVPLSDAQRYLQCGKDVSGIAIKVRDVFHANELVHDAGDITDSYIKIRSWISDYGYMYRDIQMIRSIIYIAISFVMGIACFNIISTLMIAVQDKSADIAILRTLGAKDDLTSTIFVWYGLLVGLTGSVFGLVVGILIALNLTTLTNELEHLLGCQLLSSNIYFIDFLPTELHWIDVVCILATALLLSLLASWYPAQRTNYIDPARVLRGQ